MKSIFLKYCANPYRVRNIFNVCVCAQCQRYMLFISFNFNALVEHAIWHAMNKTKVMCPFKKVLCVLCCCATRPQMKTKMI